MTHDEEIIRMPWPPVGPGQMPAQIALEVPPARKQAGKAWGRVHAFPH
jgi:hypothetical protein